MAARRTDAPKHRRPCLWLVALMLVVFVPSVVGWLMTRPAPPPIIRPPAPTLLALQRLAQLVTARVEIADVRETKIAGYLGDVKAVLVVRGEALLGPDLSKATIRCSEDQRRITIELPRPHVISCRLDHSLTRLASLSHDGLWAIVPGDAGRTTVLNRAYAEAEQAVSAVAVTPAMIEQAATQADRVLGSFFETPGWTVIVRGGT